ncbi:hypothetical protein V6N13_113817 [Hibiscus sabdariffa]
MLQKQGTKIEKVLNFAINEAVLEERITAFPFSFDSSFARFSSAILFVAVHITFGRAFNLSAFAYAETWDLFDLLAGN